MTIAIHRIATARRTDTGNTTQRRSWLPIALWTAQALLAAMFIFAGGIKLVMPLADLSDQSGLPGAFMKFIGVCEVFGGIAMIAPGLSRIRVALTPIAAVGLVIIMVGAVVDTIVINSVVEAIFPLIVGISAAFVAYGRWQLAPMRESTPSRTATDVASPIASA